MAFTSWQDFLEAKEKKDVDGNEIDEKGYEKAFKQIAPLDANEKQPVMGYGRKPNQINADFAPPQGDKPTPYNAPNTKNDSKPIARVADKWDDPIASTAFPPFKDPNASMSGGTYPDYKNLRTEEFLNTTKDMSDAEFIKQMINESKKEEKDKKDDFEPGLTCQFSGEKAIPAFYEVSKYASRLFPKNEKARKAFVRELKGVDGGLQLLLEELLGHKETYNSIVNTMANPESKAAKRMAQAMNTPYVEWISSFGNPLGESVDLPVSKRRPKFDDYKNSFDQPAPDASHVSMSDDDGGMDGSNGPDAVENPDNVRPDDRLPLQYAPSDSPANDADWSASQPMPENKKEFAYHHLIKEMSGFPHMKQFMSENLM